MYSGELVTVGRGTARNICRV